MDFSGHTITSSLMSAALFTNNSTLTFTDTASNGGVVSTNNNIVINNGTMTIRNGSFTGNRLYTKTEAEAEGRASRGVINNGETGEMTIENIYVYTAMDFGVLNLGNATINGGHYVSNSEAIGDQRNSYCVSSYSGNMIVNNATIQGVHGGLGYSGGKGTVNNVNVSISTDSSRNSYYALYIAGEVGNPEVVINGGTFTKGKQANVAYIGNSSDGGEGHPAWVTINDGTFNGGFGVVVNSKNNYGLGYLTVYGGRFTFNPLDRHFNGVETVSLVDGYYIVNK